MHRISKEDYIKIGKNNGELSAQQMAEQLGFSVPTIYLAAKTLKKYGIVPKFARQGRRTKKKRALFAALQELRDFFVGTKCE